MPGHSADGFGRSKQATLPSPINGHIRYPHNTTVILWQTPTCTMASAWRSVTLSVVTVFRSLLFARGHDRRAATSSQLSGRDVDHSGTEVA